MKVIIALSASPFLMFFVVSIRCNNMVAIVSLTRGRSALIRSTNCLNRLGHTCYPKRVTICS